MSREIRAWILCRRGQPLSQKDGCSYVYRNAQLAYEAAYLLGDLAGPCLTKPCTITINQETHTHARRTRPKRAHHVKTL